MAENGTRECGIRIEMGWLNETDRRTPITSRAGVNLTMGVAGANDGIPGEPNQ